MLWAKQSTAATLTIGPILDSTGAEYTGAVIGDISIRKADGASSAALAAAATLTHDTNGSYKLVLTTGNTDTLGRTQFFCNKSGYQCPPLELTILAAAAYDTLITNGTLASTTSGRTIAIDSAGGVTLADGVAHGGTLGSSTATLALGNVNVTSQTANVAAFSLTGNGSGQGLNILGGNGALTAGMAITSNAGTAGYGLVISGVGARAGLQVLGGATGPAIGLNGGATSGDGINITTTSGHGINVTASGTAKDALHLVGAAAATTNAGGHGISAIGGAASTSSGGTAGYGFNILGGAGAASTNGAGDGMVSTGGGTTTVSGGAGASFAHTGSKSDFNATSTPLTLAKTTNITGFNDIAATDVVSSGAITTSGGAVSSVTSVTGSVGSIATGGISATSFAAGAIDNAAIATDAIGAAELAASAVTEIQSGLMLAAFYTAPDNTSITAIKAKTDNLPASPAATGDAMTLTSGERNSVADALLDRADAIETGITERQAMRAILAMLAGVVTGAGSGTEVFKNPGGGTTRVTVTVDSSGNRSLIVTNL